MSNLSKVEQPEHWLRRSLQWLVAAGLRASLGFLSLLPREVALSFGALLGRLFAKLVKRRAAIARLNLEIAFPEKTAQEREAILLDSFANQGRHLAEIAHLRHLNRENVRRWVDASNLQPLYDAQKKSPSGGVIAVTAHFGSWEFLAAAMALYGLPFSVVHRGARNPYLEPIICGWRERAGVSLLRRGGVARAVIEGLQNGALVGIPLDQDAPRKQSVFVPFFGELAATRDGPARIAMLTGVPVIPAFMLRIDGGARHRVVVGEAIDLLPGDLKDEEVVLENTKRMNLALEVMIRDEPGQWIWGHRRYKVRPEGEPRLYPSRRRSKNDAAN